MSEINYIYFKNVADYVMNIIGEKPDIGIILGSGLKAFSGRIENPVVIPYKEIPGFLESTVESHEGRLVFGDVNGKKVICMSGRFHHYEGYPFEMLTLPIRLF